MRRLALEPVVAHPTDRPGPALPEVDAIAARVADPDTSLDDLGGLLAEAADLVAGRGDGAALVLDAEPAPEELGYMDTVKTPPGYVTRVRAKFSVPRNAKLSSLAGHASYVKWVYHCHILEH